MSTKMKTFSQQITPRPWVRPSGTWGGSQRGEGSKTPEKPGGRREGREREGR